jgi:hypothetical protein
MPPAESASHAGIEPTVLAAIIAAAVAVVGYAAKSWSDSRTVTIAILAEVQRLLQVIREHQAFWSSRMQAGTTATIPLIPFSTDVYDKQVASIGSVDSAQIAAIVKFYGYVKFLNALQARRLKHDPEEFDAMYEGSLKRILKDYGHAFDDAYGSLGLFTPPPGEVH